MGVGGGGGGLGLVLSISGAKARKSFNAPEVDKASPRSIDLMTF